MIDKNEFKHILSANLQQSAIDFFRPEHNGPAISAADALQELKMAKAERAPIPFSTVIERASLTAKMFLFEALTPQQVRKVLNEEAESTYGPCSIVPTFNRIDIELSSGQYPIEPYAEYMAELQGQELDERHTIDLSSRKQREGYVPSSWLSDSLSPSYQDRYYPVPAEVTHGIKKRADLFSESIAACQHVTKLCSDLDNSRASHVNRDEVGLRVSHLLIVALCAFYDRYMVKGVTRDAKVACSFRVGVSAVVLNQLSQLFANRLTGRLLQETALAVHAKRVLKALEKVRFVPERITGSQCFHEDSKNTAIVHHTICNQRRMAVETALRLATKKDVLRSYQGQIEALINAQRTTGREQAPYPIHGQVSVVRRVPESTGTFFRLEVQAGSGDECLYLSRINVNADPGKQFCLEESLVFKVFGGGKVAYSDTRTLLALETEDWLLHFGHSDTDRSMENVVLGLRKELWRDIITAQTELPQVFSRAQELPSETLIDYHEGLLVLSFPAGEADTLLQFHSYDQQIVANIQKQIDRNSERIMLYYIDEPEKAAETPVVEMPVQRDAVLIRREVSRLLYSNVSNFAEFSNILRKQFDVRLSNQGNGGHKGLHREGYYYCLSKDFRSETEPLDHQIAVKVLEALRIPLEKMIELLKGV